MNRDGHAVMYDCIGEVLTWTEECRFSDILK